jgi:hypothetical protein
VKQRNHRQDVSEHERESDGEDDGACVA